uniref:Uncharacterized protein n=1 Tax=Caenorhabditis tropicalis TaxID=1561998 RepID=A0A1I7UH28_9PELO
MEAIKKKEESIMKKEDSKPEQQKIEALENELKEDGTKKMTLESVTHQNEEKIENKQEELTEQMKKNNLEEQKARKELLEEMKEECRILRQQKEELIEKIEEKKLEVKRLTDLIETLNAELKLQRIRKLIIEWLNQQNN